MGRVGIHFPYGWPGPELAYTLGKPFWGRGYATEAARAALDWAFSHRDFLALMSLIYPENAASIRVATKLGETLRGDATSARQDGPALRHHPPRVGASKEAAREAER